MGRKSLKILLVFYLTVLEDLEDSDFKNKRIREEWWCTLGMKCFLLNNQRTRTRPYYYLVKLTPRLLLQLLGTDCGEILYILTYG
jgi:hypothetical protein